MLAFLDPESGNINGKVLTYSSFCVIHKTVMLIWLYCLLKKLLLCDADVLTEMCRIAIIRSFECLISKVSLARQRHGMSDSYDGIGAFTLVDTIRTLTRYRRIENLYTTYFPSPVSSSIKIIFAWHWYRVGISIGLCENAQSKAAILDLDILKCYVRWTCWNILVIKCLFPAKIIIIDKR